MGSGDDWGVGITMGKDMTLATTVATKSLRIIGSNSGLSLVEILVGFALLGMIIAFSIQTQFQMHRSFRGLMEMSARDDFEKGLVASITAGEICKSDLKGYALGSQVWPSVLRTRGPASPILFEIGLPVNPSVPSLQPSSFQLVKVADLNASSALVDFVVSYNDKKLFPKAPELIYPLKNSSIRATVSLDATGKILSCSGESDAREICEKLGGSYDPVAAIKCNIPAYYQ